MRWWGWAAIVSSVASAGCRIGFDEQVAPVAADSRVTRLVTLGERPTSEHVDVTADTLLDVARAAQNYGRSMYIGTYAPLPYRNTSLVRFELGAVPPGATVVAARLELVRTDLGDTVHGSLEARELTESWSEGLEAPATNHGLRIESPGTQTHYHFASSEAEPPDVRPQLVLELVP